MDLHPKLIDLSLDRTLDLLDRLGRPQDRLPPVVHAAGTNGKGSTLAALRAICEAAGYRVHVYTSPHLARFHERIRLAGALIDEPALLDLLEYCERVNEGRPITFFEVTTCAAFHAFAETPADILLLETGLGGRLDSTNVVARPAATVITPISMDHMQFLGDTLSKIAAEKAAIQKPGVPAVVGPQEPEAARVVTRAAEAVGAPLARHGVEWDFVAQGGDGGDGGFDFTSAAWSGALPAPALPGAHQTVNAATAVATALVLRDQGFDLPDEALSTGLTRIEWPARLQILTRGPVPDGLPGWTVILDGGHNAAAGEALAAELTRRAVLDDRPVHAICGLLTSKAATDFLTPLAPHVASLTTIAIPGEENSFTAEALREVALGAGHADVVAAPDLDTAVARLAAARPPERLLICGSLYLAGHVLRSNG
jgi:dihydrofolate synthase/folylpolyglutamate synthase